MATRGRRGQLEKWLWGFTPNVRKFYEDFFSKRPRELTEKDWAELKHKMSIEVFNRLLPKKADVRTEQQVSSVKPIEIKFTQDNASRDISTQTPTKSTPKPKEVHSDADGGSGGKDDNGVRMAGKPVR